MVYLHIIFALISTIRPSHYTILFFIRDSTMMLFCHAVQKCEFGAEVQWYSAAQPCGLSGPWPMIFKVSFRASLCETCVISFQLSPFSSPYLLTIFQQKYSAFFFHFNTLYLYIFSSFRLKIDSLFKPLKSWV